MMQKQLFINNEWKDAAGGRTIDVVNPATEEVIATVASAERSDVDAAVAAARSALDGPWARLSARDRGRLIWKLGEKLLERVDEIATLETLHTASRSSSPGTSRFPLRPNASSITPDGPTRFTARRFPSGGIFSPTPCASRSGSSPPSSRGTFRCC